MYTKVTQQALLLGATLAVANAVSIPEPTAVPAKVEVRAPVVTPAAIRFDGRHSYMYDRRNIISDIASGADDVLHSLGSVFGKDLPSYFISGKSQYLVARLVRLSNGLEKLGFGASLYEAQADTARHSGVLPRPSEWQ
jgi:hypothetical protein